MKQAIVPPESKPYQKIGDALRAQIVQGRYPVGSRLPPERHIAETYGVSRTIVREALLMLELQGSVDIRQGSGVYVMRIPHENDSEEEQLLSSDVGPFEILQARQLLESNTAAFAAKMATRADIDNLKRNIEQEQRAIALNDTAQ
ncbi:GntR family transcriptional regulator, partial [Enterococcus faecium]|nr:GntR family transcriptional regulator [Enterococcus faecium]